MKVNRELEEKILKLAGIQDQPSVTLGKISEATFQAEVIDYAKRHGWRTYHTRDSRGSDKGFPDLVLVREREVKAELKVPPNSLTADQLAWIDALKAAGSEVYVWMPDSWPEIVEVLT